jgi:hypothetical protein
MKKFIYITIVLLLFSCKSTKTNTNNQLDITSVKTANVENVVNLSTIDFSENEIIIHTADKNKPTIITDKKGNTQKFENVKKVTIKKKTEQKKDSASTQKKDTAEKVIDKSKIDEASESVSDAKNFKGIFGYIALIIFCLTIIFLIIRFRIKAKN